MERVQAQVSEVSENDLGLNAGMSTAATTVVCSAFGAAGAAAL